ncbi:MAG: hypothetical protein ABIQ18_22810 [Umezawaea sp.]
MGISRKVRMGAIAAFAGIAGMLIPAGQAVAAPSADADGVQAAASCNITRWGHTGKYMCGSFTVLDMDWDGNGSTDETFVIAPNREIWHSWDNANGWREMPGNGRADIMWDFSASGSRRCVSVLAGDTEYANKFNGSWSGWARGGC